MLSITIWNYWFYIFDVMLKLSHLWSLYGFVNFVWPLLVFEGPQLSGPSRSLGLSCAFLGPVLEINHFFKNFLHVLVRNGRGHKLCLRIVTVSTLPLLRAFLVVSPKHRYSVKIKKGKELMGYKLIFSKFKDYRLSLKHFFCLFYLNIFSIHWKSCFRTILTLITYLL